MNVRYRVELSQAERGELTAMLSKGKRAARKLKRAQILLAADAGHSAECLLLGVPIQPEDIGLLCIHFQSMNEHREDGRTI